MKRVLILFFIVMAIVAQPYLHAQNKCSIDVHITGDFPAGEPIDPETVALDDVDVRNHTFSPGKYQLTIFQPGYFPLKENVLIPVGVRVWRLQRILLTKPRTFVNRIDFDVPPGKSPWPVQVFIAPFSQSDNSKQLAVGDMIKPGTYKIEIISSGYCPIAKKVHIWPHSIPYVVKDRLIAANVEVRIADKQGRYFLIDPTNLLPHLLLDGFKVKPGTYYLRYENPQQRIVIQRKIHIAPSDRPYVIKQLAPVPASTKPIQRRLAFQFLSNGKELELAKAIIINGHDFSFTNAFAPGSKIKMIARFASYRTITATFTMPEGHGVFVYKHQLTPLVPYKFTLSNRTVTIDGITYKYQFYLDGQPVEAHLLHCESGVRRFYYKLMHENRQQRLRIYGGYRFMESSTQARRINRENFNKIDGERLVQHLAAKNKMDGQAQALEVLSKLIDNREDHARLQRCDSQSFKHLVDYLRNLPAGDSVVQRHKQQLLMRLAQLNKSKVVVVKLNFVIDYDCPPPANYPQWKAIFVSEEDQLVRIVTQGRKLAAGVYQLTLKQPGYLDVVRKVIIPETDSYSFRFSMSARPRRLSFDIFDKQRGMMVQARRILIDGAPASFQHEFHPGTALDVVVEFKDYCSYHQKIVVTPGEGPFIIKIPLRAK